MHPEDLIDPNLGAQAKAPSTGWQTSGLASDQCATNPNVREQSSEERRLRGRLDRRLRELNTQTEEIYKALSELNDETVQKVLHVFSVANG